MVDIHGSCDGRFERVRDAFERNFTDLGDVGASFAMTVEGEFVVDLWAGHRDAAGTEPWLADTIVNVYSSTKTMTALCALLLADRGELDFRAPVARYWPEFAANGKERIEVRHLMSHSAGLSGLDEIDSAHIWYDWDRVAELLAAQAPWWEPGTASGYHAITQGNLVGEVVRRISGRSLGTFLRDELAGPLGADFHVGVDPADFGRIAELIPPPVEPAEMLEMAPGSIMEHEPHGGGRTRRRARLWSLAGGLRVPRGLTLICWLVRGRSLRQTLETDAYAGVGEAGRVGREAPSRAACAA